MDTGTQGSPYKVSMVYDSTFFCILQHQTRLFCYVFEKTAAVLAFAACLLVTAFTGIVGIDGKRRVVLTEKGVTVFPADGYVSLPYAGGFIKVTVKDGVREVDVPEGWRIG